MSGIHLFLIGGKPTDEYLNIVKDGNSSNVTFLPYMSKNELNHYFLLSDLFVLPTREDIWGLVINEAISYCLPVVTTSKCLAGLELIKDNDVGRIVPTDDVESLKNAITAYMCENNLFSENMIKKRVEIITNYSIEKMACAHLKIFKKVRN